MIIMNSLSLRIIGIIVSKQVFFQLLDENVEFRLGMWLFLIYVEQYFIDPDENSFKRTIFGIWFDNEYHRVNLIRAHSEAAHGS